MAKNDAILVDGIIDKKVADGIPSADRGEAFEYFSFEQVLKNYDLSQEEIEIGWIDGRHDGGIDGLFIFVNGHPILDARTFPWPRAHAQVDLFIISCKHHDTFKEATLNTLLATVTEIFDFSRSDSELHGAYSSDVLRLRKLAAETYKNVAVANPVINVSFFYCSRGDASEVGDSVRARSEQMRGAVASFFSNANVKFVFWGASELIEQYRQTKQFTLELPFQAYMSGNGEGYIALVTLKDYYSFVCDKEQGLRRYLFDSNVRDYLGENKVNEDIAASLSSRHAPDFWWLNNGVTILATKAAISGKNIILQDIQIVNGLQTTETIYRHFKSGSFLSGDRALAIKIIVSRDEALRDQIIRATNNQTVVEQAALHATDKIQRDIEQILEKHEFYYERRKNYYRNIGKPPSRFVTPLFVAAGYVAIGLKNPSMAATLKSRFMRNEASYRRVFSEQVPIELWPKVVMILKAAEEEMLRSRNGRPHGERFLRSWRGLVGLLAVAKSLGTFDFTQRDVLKVESESIAALVGECWNFVDDRRKLSVRPTGQGAKQICVEYGRVHNLAGAEVIGRQALAPVYGSEVSDRKIELSEEFINQVDALLPQQPWMQGVHLEVAEKLGCRGSKVTKAIRRLMDTGRRLEQIRGKLMGHGGNNTDLAAFDGISGSSSGFVKNNASQSDET